MSAWFYAAVRLAIDLVYTSVLLWMALMLLDALGLAPTHIIFLAAPVR